MNLLYTGKTKDVYALENGNYLLKFKDDVTGADGVFDPGANTVGLSIEGIGNAGLRLTKFFYEKLESNQIPTHYIHADIDNNTLEVKPVTVFGKGLEVICRYKAVGSFYRRYGKYIEEGADLDAFVEITLKDDGREDPPITKDALAMLQILSEDEYETIKQLTKKIAGFIQQELKKKNIDLYDIKFEYGRTTDTNEIILIDEISGGNMRAYQNGTYIEPMKLANLLQM